VSEVAAPPGSPSVADARMRDGALGMCGPNYGTIHNNCVVNYNG
jgi:hypothetical protein